MKSINKRILLIIFALIILSVVGVSIYFNYLLHGSMPITDGEIKISGINNPVEITFDKMGIPQIWANTEDDAWFAVGWLHANDRLFQMELTRRVSQGRLSEMFGDLTLDFDRLQRKIGHSRIAKNDLLHLRDKDKLYLQAYVNGINTWANSVSSLPFEYVLLGLDFEEWNLEDCLTLLSFQTWFSDALQNNDELFYFVSEKFGEEKARELFFEYPDWGKRTVPQLENNSAQKHPQIRMTSSNIFRFDDLLIDSDDPFDSFKVSILKSLFDDSQFPMLLSHSSNCWIVSPSRSKSGKAIFASDPHLDITRLPQFWYYMGIHIEENDINVMGITTPGLPIVIMGHNGQAAWAFTAGGIDVTDEFVEKINPENKNQYKVIDKWQDFETIEELIFNSNSDEPETLKVKISRHGPIIDDNDSLGIAYAFKWAGQDKSVAKAVEAGYSMLKINSFQKFRKCVTNFGALDANWMYADINGNIGYQLGTPIPIRKDYNDNMRLPGWPDEFDWQGYQSLENTPHVYNPKQGWLATSNNKPDDANLDYNLHGNFAYDRIMRISELLESKRFFEVPDFQKYQMDMTSNYLLRWKEEAAEILKLLEEHELAESIQKWDGTGNIESSEISVLEYWLHTIRQKTLEDELGKLHSKSKLFIFEKGNLPDHSFWYDDTTTNEIVETRDDILKNAMKETLKFTKGKKWGEIQSLTIAHPLSQVPVLSGLLDLERGPFEKGGTAGTLNASFNSKKENKFKCIVGPSWRFILDFGDIDGATIVLPAGQSGHPLSEHFFDFYPMWANGERWNVPLSKEKVYERRVSLLKMNPVN